MQNWIEIDLFLFDLSTTLWDAAIKLLDICVKYKNMDVAQTISIGITGILLIYTLIETFLVGISLIAGILPKFGRQVVPKTLDRRINLFISSLIAMLSLYLFVFFANNEFKYYDILNLTSSAAICTVVEIIALLITAVHKKTLFKV